MKNIEIIKYCLDAYKKALEEHLSYKEIELRSLHLGVCKFSHITLNQPIYNKYWIERNVINKKSDKTFDNIYWGYLPGLELRVQILQKEYDHHKKWGFLAKFIKP